MEVRIELKKPVIGNGQLEGYKTLYQASWIPFLHEFSGYNMEVTKEFVETFDGNKAQIDNLTISITGKFISQVTGLPQVGEKWFKK